MQGMVPLYGFGGVPYSAVRKAAPRNLLDNSDFTNLIAQAGIGGNHDTIPYAADRWLLDSGTVSYSEGVGLTLNGTIRQKLERPPVGDTSVFVGMASGEASIRYADGAVTITSSGGVLKWVALYSGSYTEATKPEYQPKGYGAELMECLRYCWIGTYQFMPSKMFGTNYLLGNFRFPVPMRTIPSVVIKSWNGTLNDVTSWGTGADCGLSVRINGATLDNCGFNAIICDAGFNANVDYSFKLNAYADL